VGVADLPDVLGPPTFEHEVALRSGEPGVATGLAWTPVGGDILFKDLADIPDNVKNRLEIVPVRWIDRVLEVALERMPAPLPEDEAAVAAAPEAEPAKAAAPAGGEDEVVKH